MIVSINSLLIAILFPFELSFQSISFPFELSINPITTDLCPICIKICPFSIKQVIFKPTLILVSIWIRIYSLPRFIIFNIFSIIDVTISLEDAMTMHHVFEPLTLVSVAIFVLEGTRSIEHIVILIQHLNMIFV